MDMPGRAAITDRPSEVKIGEAGPRHHYSAGSSSTTSPHRTIVCGVMGRRRTGWGVNHRGQSRA